MPASLKLEVFNVFTNEHVTPPSLLHFAKANYDTFDDVLLVLHDASFPAVLSPDFADFKRFVKTSQGGKFTLMEAHAVSSSNPYYARMADVRTVLNTIQDLTLSNTKRAYALHVRAADDKQRESSVTNAMRLAIRDCEDASQVFIAALHYLTAQDVQCGKYIYSVRLVLEVTN